MTALLRPAAAPRRSAHANARPPLRVFDRPVPETARPPRNRRLLVVVGGGLLFAGVLAGNVAVQAQTTQGQFELEQLRTSARQRQAHYQQLRLQVAQLEAPQRIVERARQMGMVEPTSVTYLTPTARTSAADPASVAVPGPVPIGEAAQGWEHVKPHLDSRR
jgi:cell division protein FtsL